MRQNWIDAKNRLESGDMMHLPSSDLDDPMRPDKARIPRVTTRARAHTRARARTHTGVPNPEVKGWLSARGGASAASLALACDACLNACGAAVAGAGRRRRR